MAFLDNSGDIILDAVLTDLGRARLARGDGSFNIRKFALGDDEIDYALYRNANSALGAHPSGSAYYDIQILQTPVLEGFTNNASSMKSTLLSVPRTNVLYLPVLALAQSAQGFQDFYTGTYVIAVDQNTQDKDSSNALKIAATSGFFFGASGLQNNTAPIAVDQGLNTTELSAELPLDADLVETQFRIDIDNRFGSVVDKQGLPASVSFVDDDNIASYFITVDTNTSFFAKDFTRNTDINSAVSGPRGVRLEFLIKSSVDLATSTYLFTRLGGTVNLPGLNTATVNNVKFIDSNVRVTGITTGYQLNIPVRFAKSPS
jgi:hypothetical protein